MLKQQQENMTIFKKRCTYLCATRRHSVAAKADNVQTIRGGGGEGAGFVFRHISCFVMCGWMKPF